jgi:kynureninase
VDEADAIARDAADPLTPLRGRFLIPDGLAGPDGPKAIYLAGQSLGLQPRTVRGIVEAELDRWARLGVDAWFQGDRPWFTYDDSLREPMARIVGAEPSEVAILNTLTIDLHLLLTSFFRPSGLRRRILADGPLFPSDRYALSSHLAARGLDPETDLVVIGPRDGEATVPPEDLEAAIADHAPDLATLLLSGVNFATGQAFDIERLTTAGHAAGATVLWDLAHAVGNVELSLHDWGVDAAAWCTYKYLNGGPGSIAAIFVHERHHRDAAVPRLVGWWGVDPADDRFAMDGPFLPAAGAAGWKASTNPVLSLVPLAASLAIFDEVGLPALRERSIRLTAYLEACLDTLVPDATILTPRDPERRGAQLSIRLPDARRRLEAIEALDVVADFREPDIIRLAPIPSYDTFHDAWRAATALAETARG